MHTHTLEKQREKDRVTQMTETDRKIEWITHTQTHTNDRENSWHQEYDSRHEQITDRGSSRGWEEETSLTILLPPPLASGRNWPNSARRSSWLWKRRATCEYTSVSVSGLLLAPPIPCNSSWASPLLLSSGCNNQTTGLLESQHRRLHTYITYALRRYGQNSRTFRGQNMLLFFKDSHKTPTNNHTYIMYAQRPCRQNSRTFRGQNMVLFFQ